MEIIFITIGKVLVIGIVCLTICSLVKQIAKAISDWHASDLQAEKDREAEAERREKEKEEREEKRKAAEKEKAKANKPAPDPEAEALKKELERRERALDLTKALCTLAKGTSEQYDPKAVEGLFELYKKVDEYEQYDKAQGQ